jgi:hypothetical protein
MYEFVKTELGWQIYWGLPPVAEVTETRKVMEVAQDEEGPKQLIHRRRTEKRSSRRAVVARRRRLLAVR